MEDTAEQHKQRQKAKNIIFRLLKVRQRSEKEIHDRLRVKGIDQNTIDETLRYFKNIGYIDDRAFTQQWIHSRLLKPFGPNRIRYELKSKGIDLEIIQNELDQVIKNYCEDEIILSLAQRQAVKYKNIEKTKVKKRLYDFLLRRGFKPETISKVVDAL